MPLRRSLPDRKRLGSYFNATNAAAFLILPLLFLALFVIRPSSAAGGGLVASYAFDEGTGTTVGDSSGNNNTGAISGATWSSAGKFGKALSFNGTAKSNFVTINDSASLHLTTGMTLEAWVNPNNTGSSWRSVIFKERPGGMTYSLYQNDGSNRPVGQVYIGAEQDAGGTAAVPLNVWTYLTLTYDGASLKLYVNGALAATKAQTGSIISSTGLLKIGGDGIWAEWYGGLIDEVRIYNRALAPAEIQTDMTTAVGPDAIAPTTPTGLTAGAVTESSVALSWNASTDNVAVAGYGVYKDLSNVAGASSTGTSTTISGLTCGTSYRFSVDAFDGAGNRSPQSAAITTSTSACDTTPPTVQITSPGNGDVLSGQVTLAANASDNKSVAGVQFRLDGANLGTEDTSSPYSLSWDSRSVANGSHAISAVARDASGNTAPAADVAVTVSNATGGSSGVFTNQTFVSGLTEPNQVVFTPDGRMLILERAGKIKVVQPGRSTPDATPLLQLSVDTNGEHGALGMVLDPGFSSNGFLYVMYTSPSLTNTLSRFTVVGNAVVPSSETILWHNIVPAAMYHQGCALAFGPDGKLYFSVGDNLSSSDSPRLTSYNGKILRINSDGSVPTDNPFFDGAGPNLDAIWARGFREPFRISFDAAGTLYIGEVGESSFEEVDRGVAGANYGWPTCEGSCSVSGMTNPIFQYGHTAGGGCIIGGFIYSGTQFPSSYRGSYFYADYSQQWIRRLTFDASGNVTGSQSFIPATDGTNGSAGQPVNLLQGPDGSLYFVDIGNLGVIGGGTVHKMSFTSNQPPVVAAQASPTSGGSPLTVNFTSTGTSDPENQPLTYSWDFGDSTSATTAAAAHTYTADGTYLARLTVSDGAGSTASSPITITVGTGGGQAPGLVAAYSFNEGAGSVLNDVSAHGNNGAIANGSWTTGKNGNALSFNGTSSMVTIPDSAALDFTTSFSIEAWVNPSASGNWATVAFKERPGGMLYSLYANNGTNHSLGQVYLNGGEQNAGSSSGVPLNTWTHLSSTYDGSSLRLYVNGVLTSTTPIAGSLAATSDPLRIGGNSIWAEFFRGRIDDVRLYNRTLGASEIQHDMNTPL
jgi:glucose/arabinose dehydrogenase